MSFADPIALYHVVKRSWSAQTIPDAFDPANPCRNQCAVTALAVQRHFGGDIVKTATKGGTHFYNLIDGRYWDLAADQFDEPIPYDNVLTDAAEAHQHASEDHLATLLHNIQNHQNSGDDRGL
ncbi:YunG family protein [Novosphingobium olei]|uniref:YunG n=1 Tax=Novosphingobium olei TaxID=2728851 RepID=A0A7Y0BKW1_9SPHN|nr:hypothetical protein [Novosphingobium olei]NML92068.1 hypothetical protein [Novosphingobium olei]BEV02066.1 hypothetical protein NSDW_31600 [Novosphingobium olei]